MLKNIDNLLKLNKNIMVNKYVKRIYKQIMPQFAII